jgi:hypothetical protein
MALKLSAPPPVNSERFGDWLSDFYRQVKAELGVTIDTTESLTPTQATDLTDGGDSSLHYHAEDRKRANHTGTQTSQTISDFEARVRSLSAGQDHSQLFSLAWTQSGHTGTATTIGGFNASGVAEELTRTGTGTVVALQTSPAFTTPSLGVATATSINKVALTAPATGSTITVAEGKTFTASNTLTLTGTDGSSAAFGTGGTVAYKGETLAQFAATTSAQLAGVISDETGSGALVFATSPSFTTPVINTAASVGGVWTAAAAWTLPAFTLGGTVTSNGQSFSGTIANLGTVTTADINGGTIDGAVIGGASAAAGTFTTLLATSIATGGNSGLSGVYAQTAIGTTTHSTQAAALGVFDDTAQAINIGGTLAFGGKYLDAGTYTTWSAIQGYKENGTSGNSTGGLKFFTRGAGVYTVKLTINAAGDATFTGSITDSKGDVRTIPQNSQSTAYTLVLADAGKHILHPSADTTARTFTIPANSSVAYPVGTAITFVNQASAGTMTIAITTDTMRLAGAGTTGSRTLTANGIATALKVTTTEWIISGTNLT